MVRDEKYLNWLQNLKVGSIIYIQNNYGSSTLYEVIKLTKTEIVTKHYTTSLEGPRFRRSDGGLMGGDIWHSMWAQEYTPELKAIRIKKIKILKIKESISKNKIFEILSNQEIDTIYNILGDAENKSVHLSHCFQGEYVHSCKYGEDDTCPAKPKNETDK